MQSVPVFIGLDYHSGSIQTCVVDATGKVLLNRKQESSVMAVLEAMQPWQQVQRVAIEACSGAADFADHLSRATGWRVSLSHPGLVSKMRSSIDKTDRSDARVLADLCRTGYLPEVWLPPEPIRELRTLVRRRHQLTDAQRACKQRIKSVLRDKRLFPPVQVGSRWTMRYRHWLEHLELPAMSRLVLDNALAELDFHRAQRDRLDEHLRQAMEGDAIVQRLMGIKGIGEVTAWTIRAVIGRFDRFRNAKQLARYCGLTPRNASSGERVADAGVVRACDPVLKTMLVQVAHRLVRAEGEWCERFQHLRSRGKPVCVAVVAIANHWTRRLWHEFKGLGDPAIEV